MNVLSRLFNKHITVVGLGVTGRSCVRFLKQHQKAWNIDIAAMDTRLNIQAESDIECVLGELDKTLLAKTDVIVLSPGIALKTPEIATAIEHGKWVIGDIELFAMYVNEHAPQTPILGVTGSNGKSTVVTLLNKIAQQAGLKPALGGNIGTPVLDLLEQDVDVFILELSSFQLETTQSLKLTSAAILNVCEDHMDRYDSFEDYVLTKQKIYLHAKSVVYFEQDSRTSPAWKGNTQKQPVKNIKSQCVSTQYKAKGWSTSVGHRSVCLNGNVLLSLDDIQLAGVHNLLNIQTAFAMSQSIGISLIDAVEATKAFEGLSHRCQKIASKHGVDWINDSKATNVGATIAAIEGLAPTLKGKLYLILGGDAKGADVSPLKPALDERVTKAFSYGQDASLFTALGAHVETVSHLQMAVEQAARIVESGDTVLLSPACASFDMFKSYLHRGECFIEAVEAVA